VRVELTATGSLIIPADVAQTYMEGSESAMAATRGDALCVMPIRAHTVGGLIVKQRNARGDRSILVVEQLPRCDGVPAWTAGERAFRWDEEEKALRIPLQQTTVVRDARL